MRPHIDAPAGTFVGLESGGIDRFLGIPYAEAPTGPLRFSAPVRRAVFATPFDASHYGATPQRVPLFEKTTIPEPSIAGHETLNLNVFAPHDGVGLPVLLWIHGGGYVAGSAASPWYDGSGFARDGVIVVSVSYRLGVDGFGVLPSMPTNLGLRDVISALEWVRENITAFGGDPERVTIAGQSAGGGVVLALLASPLAAGLFSAAISVSGVDFTLSLEEGAEATDVLAAALGVETTREGFESTDDLAAQRAVLALRDTSDAVTAFAPVRGDDVLPDDIVTGVSLRSPVPLLIGSTADEFDGGPTPENPEIVNTTAEEKAAARESGRRMTDTLFRAVIPRIAQARSGVAPTWVYSFEWPSPVTQGATHCVDVPFIFDNLDQPGIAEALGPQPPDELAQREHADFVAFARDHTLPWATNQGNKGGQARKYGDVSTVADAGSAGAVTMATGSVADVAGLYDPVVTESVASPETSRGAGS